MLITCCSFLAGFPVVLFPSFSFFLFSFNSALAGAALNSFFATNLPFSFFDSSLSFLGSVGR